MAGKTGTVRKASRAKAAPKAGPAASLNLDELIQKRAYELYLETGDDALVNWARAEREIKDKYQVA